MGRLLYRSHAPISTLLLLLPPAPTSILPLLFLLLQPLLLSRSSSSCYSCFYSLAPNYTLMILLLISCSCSSSSCYSYFYYPTPLLCAPTSTLMLLFQLSGSFFYFHAPTSTLLLLLLLSCSYFYSHAPSSTFMLLLLLSRSYFLLLHLLQAAAVAGYERPPSVGGGVRPQGQEQSGHTQHWWGRGRRLQENAQ